VTLPRAITRRAIGWFLALLVIALPIAAFAQRGGGGRFFGFGGRRAVLPNVPYDGRFTMARIRYQPNRNWDADYPTMERNLTVMLDKITALSPHLDGSNVHDFDDPELLKYPLAYLTEPGYWHPSPAEVEGLRTYIAKGGFLIVDDFHFANEWWVFEQGIRAALPSARIERLDISHPIFNCFFQIPSLVVPYPGRLGEAGLMGEFYGIYEDNDPSKRLQVVINYNIDIGDYMEWSNEPGWFAAAPTNEAYKFAINYIVYGMSH
jgi:hypothetical protein